MCPRYTIGHCGYTHQHQPPGGSSSAARDCPEDKGWVLLGARFPPGKGFLYGLLDMGTETSKAPQPCPALQLPPSAPRHSALLPVAPSLHHPRPISSPQQDRAQGLRGPPVLEVPLHRNAGQQERPPSRPIRVSGGWGLSLQASGSSAELSIPSSSMEEQRTAGQSQTGVECWGDYPRPGPPQGQGP